MLCLALMAKVFGGAQVAEVNMSWLESSSVRETEAERSVFFFS